MFENRIAGLEPGRGSSFWENPAVWWWASTVQWRWEAYF